LTCSLWLIHNTLALILAGLAGTIPNTTYSGNIAIVELTGVASRQVGIFGAGILVLLAFFPWLNALVMAIPEPVLGASMFIFFALLFVTGLKLVFQSGINSRSAFITGISFWIGFAAENRLFFPDFIPAGTEAFLHNGMAVGGVTAFQSFTLVPHKRHGSLIRFYLSA
jgi:xanthine/uracil permease